MAQFQAAWTMPLAARSLAPWVPHTARRAVHLVPQPAAVLHSASDSACGQPRGASRAWAAPVAVLVAACQLSVQKARRRRRAAAVARRAAVTGPGWTDELARIFDPRDTGPKWLPEFGYRGRPRLRLLLDAEDLMHSYSQALHLHTGKWTGPLSAGVEKPLFYGAWAGGAPEDPNPNRGPEEPQMLPPEVLTFVACPADLIEAVNPIHLADAYPSDVKEKVGRCLFGEEGFFINEWLRSLQDQNRLITWGRPARMPGGAARPNALLMQKHYRSGKPVGFKSLRKMPIMLSQVVGAGMTLKVGEKVEAMKSGKLLKGKWLPSQWMPAEVLAVNYDGTYDLQFKMDFGPFRENKKKGLHGLPQLSLRANEVYKENWGADTMPAQFRMMQELNYAQAVPPDQIRLPGMFDRVSDTTDTEGNQDWYICSSRKFLLTSSAKSEDNARLEEFTRRFQLGYRWVPTVDGLRFEPVPNPTMAAALRASHRDVAQQFKAAAEADEDAKRRIKLYKENLKMYETQLEQLPEVQPAKPSRPAGPRGIGLLVDSPPKPVQVPAVAQ